MVEHHTLTVDGVEYVLGSAGSLILACDGCGQEHFRSPENYFGPPPAGDPSWHRCWNPGCPKRTSNQNVALNGNQLQPIRVDELESKWRPLWWRRQMRPIGDDGKAWSPS